MLASSRPHISCLACVYATLVPFLVSAVCELVQHHIRHYPYSPSGQSGKPTPWCQQQSVLSCLVNGNSLPVTHFPCYPGNSPSPSQSFTGTQAERIAATHTVPHSIWWPRASSIQWSLRLFYPLDILPPFLLWSLRLLYLLGILLTTPIVLLILIVTPTVLLYLTVHTVR